MYNLKIRRLIKPQENKQTKNKKLNGRDKNFTTDESASLFKNKDCKGIN